jgi:hypothetical protein
VSYTTWNGAAPTSAALVKVTTGTAIKTMLQVATPATRQARILSWGYSLDAAPATTGVGVIELLQCDTAATVTAHVAAGIVNDDPGGTASLMTLGTTATGYTSTVENAPAVTRMFDNVEISGVSNGAGPTWYVRDFMPNQQRFVAVSKFLRVRATFSAAVNMICWVTWDEI